MFIAVAAPNGGLGNFPALVQGDDGATPDIDLDINFTALDFDDPTAEFASWDETSPNVYQLTLGLRNGAPGIDGGNVLDPTDYGTPIAGKLLRVKSDLSGFEYASEKVGGRDIPATINAAGTGNVTFTLCTIAFDAQPFDWWPTVDGCTIVTGTGSDVAVDLVARLGTTGITLAETTGPEVNRTFGIPGMGPYPMGFSGAPPVGSSVTYAKVLAGNTATVYIRLERRAGSNTFSTVADTSRFSGWVNPIP